MVKRRDKNFIVRIDEETLEGAHEYAQSHGVSLGAIVRAILKRFAGEDPPPLPPEVNEEMKRSTYRPSRKKKK